MKPLKLSYFRVAGQKHTHPVSPDLFSQRTVHCNPPKEISSTLFHAGQKINGNAEAIRYSALPWAAHLSAYFD